MTRFRQEARIQRTAQRLVLNQLQQRRAQSRSRSQSSSVPFSAKSVPLDGMQASTAASSPARKRASKPQTAAEPSPKRQRRGDLDHPRQSGDTTGKEKNNRVEEDAFEEDIFDEESSGSEEAGGPLDSSSSLWVPHVESVDQIDWGTLQSLPPSMQQQYIAEVRRQQRQQVRSDLLPVAADPGAFSSRQLRNFLQSADLSLKVDRINAEQAKAVLRGQRIAGEAGRQFFLEKDGASRSAGAVESKERESEGQQGAEADERQPTSTASSDTARAAAFSVVRAESVQPGNPSLPPMPMSWRGSHKEKEPAKRDVGRASMWQASGFSSDEDAFSDAGLESPVALPNQGGAAAPSYQPPSRGGDDASKPEESSSSEGWSDASEDAVELIAQEADAGLADNTSATRGGPSFQRRQVMTTDSSRGADSAHGAKSTQVDVSKSTFENSEESSVEEVTAPEPLPREEKEPAKDATEEAIRRAVATAGNLTSWAGAAVSRILQASARASSSQGSSSAQERTTEQDTSQTSASSAPAIQPAVQETPREESRRAIHEEGPPGQSVDRADESDGDNLEELHEEEKALRDIRRRSQRDADTITEDMRRDVMQLLDLFGVPYIVAPMEAEAQCAELERLGLVQGVVTDDSDVFLFGANVVYRNMFDEAKFVEAYTMRDIEKELGFTREDLICIAMLLGSDYTLGIKGVGIVNAVEIVRAFPGMDGLREFRRWLEGLEGATERPPKSKEELAGLSVRERFKHTHRNARRRWTVDETFPNAWVSRAYLHPTVSSRTDAFQWRTLDYAALEDYCARRLQWTSSEVEKLLHPVMQAQQERAVQTSLSSHFLTYEGAHRTAKVRSRRLRSALEVAAPPDVVRAMTRADAQPDAAAGRGSAPDPARDGSKDEWWEVELESDDSDCVIVEE